MQEASGKSKPEPSQVYLGVHGISCFEAHIRLSQASEIHTYSFQTPVDETHNRLIFRVMRNFLLEPENDEMVLKSNIAFIKDDRVVLEPVQPKIMPPATRNETIVPADKASVRYRQWVKELEDKGWRIDMDEVTRNKDKVAYAIRSPARRTSKGWAIDPVPLRPGAELKRSTTKNLRGFVGM